MRKKSVAWILPVLAATTVVVPARAGNPFAEMPRHYASTPAHVYAEMDADTCHRMLDDRGVAYERVSAGELVDAPVQLAGSLHGVTFTHVHPRPSGAVLDCRLALALDDLSVLLAEHGVVEVGYFAAFRPAASGSAKPGQRHPAGLAMDIRWLLRDSGDKLLVEKDYDGRVGARTCGPRAQQPEAGNQHGLALRKLVCDAARARLFHLVLTPNYDRQHHDHIHVEVRRNVRWFLVQ